MDILIQFCKFLFISDPGDDKPIPADVILLGCDHGQIGLPTYKYFSEEEVRARIDQLELEYCVDLDRVSDNKKLIF